MLDYWPYIRWTDALDLVLVTGLVWAAFNWLRHTRSRFVLIGLLLASSLYLASRQLELQLTVWILQGFFTILVFVLVVVFQDDLRRIFEQIAIWGLRQRPTAIASDAIDTLERVIERQVKQRMGALYVIPGREPLDRHLEGGIELDGLISEPLLLSVFDHHSPGHDGAVVLAGERIARFAVHLPLSVQRIRGGTRHAAGLGLTERSDALTITVSEERGTVSVARGGKMRRLESPELLAPEIRAFLSHLAGRERHGRWRVALGHLPQLLAAAMVAAAMWWVLVAGSADVETVRRAEVAVENLPAGYRLTGVDPDEIQVTLSGPRRLLPGDSKILRVRVDAVLAELGRRTFQISPASIELPAGVIALAVEPEKVKLSLEKP